MSHLLTEEGFMRNELIRSRVGDLKQALLSVDRGIAGLKPQG